MTVKSSILYMNFLLKMRKFELLLQYIIVRRFVNPRPVSDGRNITADVAGILEERG